MTPNSLAAAEILPPVRDSVSRKCSSRRSLLAGLHMEEFDPELSADWTSSATPSIPPSQRRMVRFMLRKNLYARLDNLRIDITRYRK